MSNFLVVKTVNVLGRPFAGATATFEGAALQPVANPGVLECALDPVATGGLVQVSATKLRTVEQQVTFNLGGAKPTIAFSGLQAINALRVAVSSRGTDFNLEVHVVVDTDLCDRLDAFRQSVSGPYTLDGRTVFAAPHFNMRGGVRHKLGAQLQGAVAGAHIPPTVFSHLANARVTPAELRQLTQALIDAEYPTPADFDVISQVIDNIRSLAWEYGIGIDCAGYVQQAFLASRRGTRDAFGLKVFENEDLTGLSSRGPFRKINIRRARTGDLIVLDPPPPPPGEPPHHDVGHTAIVYWHIVANNDIDLLTACGEDDDVRFLVAEPNAGPAHLYYVDASWGAGSYGNPAGGVQRKPWYFNEATKEWAWLAAVGRLRAEGAPPDAHPYGHPLQAVYRPKQEV